MSEDVKENAELLLAMATNELHSKLYEEPIQKVGPVELAEALRQCLPHAKEELAGLRHAESRDEEDLGSEAVALTLTNAELLLAAWDERDSANILSAV